MYGGLVRGIKLWMTFSLSCSMTRPGKSSLRMPPVSFSGDYDKLQRKEKYKYELPSIVL